MELMEEMNECICNTVECESRPSGLVRLATIKLGLNSKEKKKNPSIKLTLTVIYLLSSEIREFGSHRSDLSNRPQNVISFFGILTHVCNLFGLSEQSPDVLLSLWTSIRVREPVLDQDTFRNPSL